MTWLLRLYPRAWRERYGAEVMDVIERERPTVRLAVDLIAGAIDARVNPQWTSGRISPAPDTGVRTMAKLLNICDIEGVNRSDQWRSAAWMIGGTVFLTMLSLVLTKTTGRSAFSEALGYAAFPMALMTSSECTWLKRYSTVSRSVMIVAGSVGILLMMWGAVAIGNRI